MPKLKFWQRSVKISVDRSICRLNAIKTEENMPKNGYVFQTELPLRDCMERITSLPWEFEDVWSASSLWYTCQAVSPTRLLITFTGGQFRRARRTEYMMDFMVMEQTTVIEVKFQKEMLGLPPMMTAEELDAFMRQKVQAERIGVSSVS
jgi:hypothetical protein